MTKADPDGTGPSNPRRIGRSADGYVVAAGEDRGLAGLHDRLILHHGAGGLEVAEMGSHADHDEHDARHQGDGQNLQVGGAVGSEERMSHDTSPVQWGRSIY